MTVNDHVAFLHPSGGIMFGTVIDADPAADTVLVDVPGEPFFRRIPEWMLRVVPTEREERKAYLQEQIRKKGKDSRRRVCHLCRQISIPYCPMHHCPCTNSQCE